MSILARLADREEEREYLGCGITILVEWLNSDWIRFPRVQEAALDALSSLCKGTSIASLVSNQKIQGKDVTSVLFNLLGDKRASMRLGASSCIVNLFNSSALTSDFEWQIGAQLLPALIRLFDDKTLITSQLGMNVTSIQERALSLFSVLLHEQASLQRKAMEGAAISKLAKILEALVPQTQGEVPENAEKLIESTLLAIAAVSSLTEECRRQVIAMKLLPSIVACLENPNVLIRNAACKSSRSLSRSVKNLRTSLMDAGIAQPLFNLLFDNDIQVQITASATLCNIVLDFSPMKKIVIERGGVKQLVSLVQSSNEDLRLNAAWALKNMLFQTDIETKKGVMQHLGWNTLIKYDLLTRILRDEDISIQVQALNLWRNLACAKVQDIDFVFEGLGREVILDIIQEKFLAMHQYPQIILQVFIANQTIYIVVNIAVGSMEHKSALMSRPSILNSIIQLMVFLID